MTRFRMTQQLVCMPLATLLFAAAAGCEGADAAHRGTIGADPQPATEVSASAVTVSELQIAKWQIFKAAEGTMVKGLDDGGGTLASVILQALPTGQVQVSRELLATDFVVLDDAGKLTGAEAPDLRRLATALHHDLGTGTGKDRLPVSAGQEGDAANQSAGADGDLKISSDLVLPGDSGDIGLGWSLFGYSGNVVEGRICASGTARDQAFAMANDPAHISCSIVDWVDRTNQQDCRVIVHYGIGGFNSGTCHWEVNTLAAPTVPESQGAIPLGWSFFGYSANVIEGDACAPGRTRSSADAHADDPANISCSVVGWLSPSDQHDCRIIVHYGIGGFRTGTCFWSVLSQ